MYWANRCYLLVIELLILILILQNWINFAHIIAVLITVLFTRFKRFFRLVQVPVLTRGLLPASLFIRISQATAYLLFMLVFC